MPIQAPQWTEFLSCPICFNIFDEQAHRPISLGCGHTVCKTCLSKLTPRKCPFDQNSITRDIDELPVNYALLQLVGVAVPECEQEIPTQGLAENVEFYNSATRCIEELAMYLKPSDKDSSSTTTPLSRPMQRKLVTLLNCQLIEDEGRARAVRAARSLAERTVTELILQHQNPQQLSANLWAGVRARGCQFLGPAMQEEVLKLILLALEDGSPLSRKVLVLFVVQRLESQYPQASKTAIGHVVQLLYRASCFKVTKREEESSLMQLKEEFCTYDALRREHDSQIVQIATEAGLRISPEQWSSLLYGDTAHKSHMQSIIDKLQTPQSFSQSINELTMALQRTGDPGNLSRLKTHLELLANVDPSSESSAPTWEILDITMQSIKAIVEGLIEFGHNRTSKKPEFVPLHNPKFKTSMCRDLIQKGKCPRGTSCTFAHSQDELERYRQMSKKGTSVANIGSLPVTPQIKVSTSSALTPQERESLKRVIKNSNAKMGSGSIGSSSRGDGQMVTSEIQRGTRKTAAADTASAGPALARRDKMVSIPIAKPCSLPTNTKARMESSIYSLSLLNDRIDDDSLHPGIIPVAKKISSPQGHKGQSLQPTHHVLVKPHQKPLHSPVQPAAAPPQYQASVCYPSSPPMYTDMAYSPAIQTQQVHSQGRPSQDQGGGDNKSKGGVKTMTAVNPQPVDCYGLNARDRACYGSMVMRGRGKSPSEQLEELHCRKSELLAQLNRTRTQPKDGQNHCTEELNADPGMELGEENDGPVDGSWEHMASVASFSTQSVLDMNEISSAMLHHLGLSEQLSYRTDLQAAESGQYPQSGMSHQMQGYTTANSGHSPSKLSSYPTTLCTSGYSLDSSARPASTYETGPLSQETSMHIASTHSTVSFNQEPSTSMNTATGYPLFRPVVTAAPTHSTMSLTQENFHSLGLQYPAAQLADELMRSWSSGNNIVDVGMSSTACQVEEDLEEEVQLLAWKQEWNEVEDAYSKTITDECDEFVPFNGEYSISKYGPISRMLKTKLQQQEPVQVTAGQMVFNYSGSTKTPQKLNHDTQPVNAITPLQRPYPITSQVPSRFLQPHLGPLHPSLPAQTVRTPPVMENRESNSVKKAESADTKAAKEGSQEEVLRNPKVQHGSLHDHKPDPNGIQVAASLPTALLQPNVLARANRDTEPHTLWMLRRRMSSHEQNQMPQRSAQPVAPEKLRSQIADLNSKIEHLQLSEDERLVRELQTIELSIVQTERKIDQSSPVQSHLSVNTPPPRVHLVNHPRPPFNVQAHFPEQLPTDTPVYANLEQQNLTQPAAAAPPERPVVVGRPTQQGQNYCVPAQAVDYLIAREAQKLEITRQNARVMQESKDRLYAEDIAKREMEKFVRSSNE